MSGIVQLTRFGTMAPDAPWAVVRRELIPASPERVWQALTEPRELVQWWCDSAETRLEPGGHYRFGGRHVYGQRPEPGPSPAQGGHEITEIEAAERLTFRWPILGVDTLVRYELENLLESTRLTVTQTANAPPGWDPGSGPNWWWVALPALRTFLERGEPDLRLDYSAAREVPVLRLEVRCTTFPWVLWHKLTSPGEIRRWWAPVLELEATPGGKFRLDLGGIGPRRALEVTELSAFSHDWLWPGGSVGRIEWRLEETETHVLLSVTDFGPWDPGWPREAIALYWGSTLLHLKQLSERGITPGEYQDG